MGEHGFEDEFVYGYDLKMILEDEDVEFLVSAEGKVPLSSCEGKTNCLFFSANKRRPCMSFIPHLVNLYTTLKHKNKNIEIIFISFDRDKSEFNEHFESMPWLAVPFDPNLHERLTRRFNVTHIPALIPVGPDGIEKDAVTLVEDYGPEAFPFTRRRREELEAMDKAKRHRCKIEELLGHEERDFVIGRHGRKISISELVGNTIGLYFGAHWCPPSRNFTEQLIEAYTELVTIQTRPFEIIFVSFDSDKDEFNKNLATMPWLAIPYPDHTGHDLKRIFRIKEIPSLVFIDPDGRTIRTDGRKVISDYGPVAYPFTETSIAQVEAGLRKEREALPNRVQDRRHEHELKLDRAKAYVCDACAKQGRFWAFSCTLCNYDLHPSCLEQSFLDTSKDL